jgi:alpha-glucosidase
MTKEALRDPIGRHYWPHTTGRDPERSPLPWDDSPGRGFTRPGVNTWLPMGTPVECNVAAQRDDPGSVLTFVRDIIALRESEPDLRGGSYATVASPAGTWVWERGAGFVIALNLSDGPVTLEGLDGSIALGTDRRRDGEPVAGRLELSPGEGALIRA